MRVGVCRSPAQWQNTIFLVKWRPSLISTCSFPCSIGWKSLRYPFSLDSDEATLYAKMYKENEIAKARFALLQKTNMLEYALDVFKTIYGDEEPPKGSLSCWA